MSELGKLGIGFVVVEWLNFICQNCSEVFAEMAQVYPPVFGLGWKGGEIEWSWSVV